MYIVTFAEITLLTNAYLIIIAHDYSISATSNGTTTGDGLRIRKQRQGHGWDVEESSQNENI